jgi:hypothetical protein
LLPSITASGSPVDELFNSTVPYIDGNPRTLLPGQKETSLVVHYSSVMQGINKNVSLP